MDEGRTIYFIKSAGQTQAKKVEKKADSAVDKAMRAAAAAGKPTTTGLAAGAGLGTILAALGSVSRKDNGHNSVLTNPLLLGALGATGGYLAGNALDSVPETSDSNGLTGLLAALGAGGAGVLGSSLSKEDAEGAHTSADAAYANTRDIDGHSAKELQTAEKLTADQKGKMRDRLKDKIKAERRLNTGIFHDATEAQQIEQDLNGRIAGIRKPTDKLRTKVFRRLKDLALESYKSPLRSLQAIGSPQSFSKITELFKHPFDADSWTDKIPTSTGTIRKLNGRKVARRAAMLTALLGTAAAGGNAIYNATKD